MAAKHEMNGLFYRIRLQN